MTSEPKPADCYVYITLPGQVTPVTAGRFALISDRHGNPLGQFVYGRSYLARPDAVALDPIELKLARQTYETVRLKGVFGALRDAIPDHWGRRVIERHVGKAPLSELDYLLHSPEDRAGALGFGLNQVPPVDTMEQKVQDTWYKVARGAGVSEADCAAIAGAFAYPGFRFPLRP